MKLKKMTPHSLSYVMSLCLGLLLLIVVMVLFLRLASGSIWVALSLAFMSTLVLSFLLSWVDIQEEDERKSDQSKLRDLKRRKL